MNERLLQYIWQFQYFNQSSLTAIQGEAIQIIHAGSFNTNQGPDFLNAKIKIGNIIWVGNVELHIYSSCWKDHKHSSDKNYNNVILHVVWNDDIDLKLSFPTIALQNRVPKLLLKRYEELMNTYSFIACERNLHKVKDIIWYSWKERLLIDRLQIKSQLIFHYLKLNNNNWEETLWWMLAKNLGTKVNTDAFEKIAQSLPINILAKHKNQIHQLEALLFGQAGLLENNFQDDYPVLLQKEYQFLKKKYKLQRIHLPIFFLRMRPANFPSIRLAQLAMLIHQSVHLFSKIKEINFINDVKKLLNVTANDYWHYHYVFNITTAFKKKNLGNQMIENICINTIVPLLFAYGYFHNEAIYKDKAIKWLMQISAESNIVTKGFMQLSIENKTAFDSQALIQLKNEYCNKKRCLDCAVGNKIIKE